MRTDTSMFMNAGRSGRAAAGADGDLAPFEVTEELDPFIVGGGTVLLGGTQCTTAGEERKVGLDGFVGVDGLVAEGDVNVAMPGDDLRDVRRQAAHDGVGDEDPAEVVRREAQRAALAVGEAGVGERASEDVAERAVGHSALLAAEPALEQPRRGRLPHTFSSVVGGHKRVAVASPRTRPMTADSTSASSGLITRSRSASVLDGAICRSGTSSSVVGSRYWTIL
jgi:hypothetical protein